jgi:protein arginine N-methyltransferase 2
VTDYLDEELVFLPDRIEVRSSGIQVMMAWELPVMRRMAEVVTARRGDVLEIGFGMGISCDEVQRIGPRSHTIVEAHPQIIERAEAWAADKPSARIIGARWQDVIDELGPFDGISFDIFGGTDQRVDFFRHLDRLLSPHGVATLWLGDDPDLPGELRALVEGQGFVVRGMRVSAVPDKRCTYSRTNEFVVPVIARA